MRALAVVFVSVVVLLVGVIAPQASARVRWPASAEEYSSLWAGVDPAQWGAADVSLSVKMPSGKVVWLYGDTISTGRFVHSSAIVQRGRDLHVSFGGTQLLPDEAPNVIYWVETARAVAWGKLEITAGQVWIGTNGVWDFHRNTELSRVAVARVTKDNDVKFLYWKGWVPEPVREQYFEVIGPNHFVYSREHHPWAKLTSGKTLTTTCQGWDDGTWHVNADGTLKYEDYRPIWSEE